jgi:hypothetical protein
MFAPKVAKQQSKANPSWTSSPPSFRSGRSQVSSPLPGIAQPKLVVEKENDPLEREAEHVTDHVMRAPDRRLSACAAPPRISRKSAAADTGTTGALDAPPLVHEALDSPGLPLDADTRDFFEPRFRHDFSRVRVHADPVSAESARSVNALAYTVGEHIVFGNGQYERGTHRGARLLAHELSHVVQQGGGLNGGTAPLRSPAASGASLQRQVAAGPLLLPKYSQSTEDQIKSLMTEHPRLTRANAERAVRGPEGATTTLSGSTAGRTGNQPPGVKGPAQTSKVPDIEFSQRTSSGNLVLRREVKTWEGNQGKFNDSLKDAKDKLLAHGSGGEVLVQVPPGTDARNLMNRFKGAGSLSPEKQAERLGWYRSIKITIVDPAGKVLLDEPIEFPPSRIVPPGGTTPPTGTVTKPGGTTSTGTPSSVKAPQSGAAKTEVETHIPATTPKVPAVAPHGPEGEVPDVGSVPKAVAARGTGAPTNDPMRGMGGVIAIEALFVLLDLAARIWLQQHYAQWLNEGAQKTIQDRLQAEKGRIDAAVKARQQDIAAWQAQGKAAYLYIELELDWQASDIGAILMRAELSRLAVSKEGEPGLEPHKLDLSIGGFFRDLLNQALGRDVRYEIIPIKL